VGNKKQNIPEVLCLQTFPNFFNFNSLCGITIGEERGVYRVLVGKPEGRRQMGRPRHRWVDNIRMDLQEVGRGHMD